VKWLGECCGIIYLNKYINILRTKITPYLNLESKRKIREICHLVEYSFRIIINNNKNSRSGVLALSARGACGREPDKPTALKLTLSHPAR
jgi:hypothetical protein